MPSKPSTKNVSRQDASQKILLQNLRQMVAKSEAHLYESAIHPGEDKAVVKARIKENLKAVKEHLSAADSPVQVNSQYPSQYVHHNPWRSIGISACANLIVAIKNVKH